MRVQPARGEDFDSILVAAQTGAEWALAALFRSYQPRLVGYLRGAIRQEAEDLASDVWVEVATSLGRFAGREQEFRAWLFTIAHRNVIDFRRKTNRRRTQPVPADWLAGFRAPDDPETFALEAAISGEVLAAINSLPKTYAEVLLLRVIAGLTVHETALVLGKRPGTVRVAQHRASRRLVKEWTERRSNPLGPTDDLLSNEAGI